MHTTGGVDRGSAGFVKKRKVDEDTVKQLMLTVRDNYFPRFEVPAVRFVLDLVDHGPPNYKRPALLILRGLMPYLSKQHQAAQATVSLTDLIGPLFRLLGTPYGDDALHILENTLQAEMNVIRCAVQRAGGPARRGSSAPWPC